MSDYTTMQTMNTKDAMILKASNPLVGSRYMYPKYKMTKNIAKKWNYVPVVEPSLTSGMPASYQTLDNLRASMDFEMPNKFTSGGNLYYRNENPRDKEDFVIMPGRFDNSHGQWQIVPTIKPYTESFQYKNKENTEHFQYKNPPASN